MKGRTVGRKRVPVVSMSQARRLAQQAPDLLVEQIGLLLNERTAIKHERNILRCLMDDIIKTRTEEEETKEELLKRIQLLAYKAYMDRRNIKHKEDEQQEEE